MQHRKRNIRIKKKIALLHAAEKLRHRVKPHQSLLLGMLFTPRSSHNTQACVLWPHYGVHYSAHNFCSGQAPDKSAGNLMDNVEY